MSKPSEMAGLTPAKCAKACHSEICVISGQNYCAHPRKGGLQGVDLHSAEAVERLKKARKMLDRQAIDER